MSYLEKLLPEFRKGAKIRCINWKKDKFLSLKENGSLLDQDGNNSFFYGADFLFNDWEFYKDQEPDWDYIINNKCPCWFWDDEKNNRKIGILTKYDGEDTLIPYFDQNIRWYKNCRPVSRDEVTFYEDKSSPEN